MILYMEYLDEGKRGGEIYHSHFHKSLSTHLEDLFPKQLDKLPQNLKNPIKHIMSKLSSLKKHNPDLIIVDISSAFRSFAAVRWMKKRKRNILVIVQGERLSFRYRYFFMKWLVRWFEKYLLKNADIILANSQYIADVSKKYASRRKHVVIAYPGLEFKSVPEQITYSSNTNEQKPVNLLFIGQCTYRKGAAFLIKAIGILKDMNIHLNLAGEYFKDGKYYKEIESIIKKYDISDKVTFLGFLNRSELAELYLKSDIFLLPSLAEGYGMVLAEALCYGLPAVVSRVGAIPEMIDDGVNGILVNPGDSQALADSIRRLVEDVDLRNSMSKANLEKAKTLPTWDDFDRAIEEKLMPLIRKYN